MKIADTSFYVFQALNSLKNFRISKFINNERVRSTTKTRGQQKTITTGTDIAEPQLS